MEAHAMNSIAQTNQSEKQLSEKMQYKFRAITGICHGRLEKSREALRGLALWILHRAKSRIIF